MAYALATNAIGSSGAAGDLAAPRTPSLSARGVPPALRGCQAGADDVRDGRRPIPGRRRLIELAVMVIVLSRFTGVRREHLAPLRLRATHERTRLHRDGTR